jgi:hypothetical protein
MLRQILAVAAGFVTISVLMIGTEFALLRFLFRTAMAVEGPAPPAYLLAYGAGSLVYAVIGGCLTASIAGKHEAPTILGALLLGMGIGNLFMNRSNQPIWYSAMVPLVGAIAATMAGYRWLGRIPERGN